MKRVYFLTQSLLSGYKDLTMASDKRIEELESLIFALTTRVNVLESGLNVCNENLCDAKHDMECAIDTIDRDLEQHCEEHDEKEKDEVIRQLDAADEKKKLMKQLEDFEERLCDLEEDDEPPRKKRKLE
jgi:hypothetical protein